MSETLLYVSDDETRLALAARHSSEYSLRTARDASKALALVHERNIAAMICDFTTRDKARDLLELAARERPDLKLVELVDDDFCESSSVVERSRMQHVLRRYRGPSADALAALFSDLLERVRTEGRLRMLEQRLCETERVYALGAAAASISNELRNPIAAVATNFSVLRDGLATLSASIGAEHPLLTTVQEMTLTLSDARSAIQEIVDVARGIELSQRRRDAESASDLAEVVRLTLRVLQGEIQRCARLEVVLGGEAAWVKGGRADLGQVVLNLLVRAMRSFPQQARHDNLLRVRILRDTSLLCLQVELEAPQLEPVTGLLAEPAQNASREPPLSLSIARGALEKLGGALQVSESEGKVSIIARFVAVERGATSAA